jgi:hypothetical protein
MARKSLLYFGRKDWALAHREIERRRTERSEVERMDASAK